ncbi:MAG: helix-turn-helix domain-containing protein [Microcoleaceae cyanobacterium]
MDKLRLTQRHIAELLGTRRATISEAAGQLQKRGIIRYTRGEITILSRSGLEEAACSCYGLLHHEKERLRAISQTIR